MGKAKQQQKKQSTKDAGPSKYKDAERRQGRRFLFFWLPIIIVVLLFFYAFAFDPPRPLGKSIPGIIREGDQTRSGDAPGKAYMVVLDDGRLVELAGSQMGPLEPGRRILVQENITLIFQRRSFSFVRQLK